MSDRPAFVDQQIAEALTRALRDHPAFRVFGPWIDLTFPAANTDIKLAHGLDATPDGVDVAWATAPVVSQPHLWDRSYAVLRATATGSARVSFYLDRRIRNDARRHL